MGTRYGWRPPPSKIAKREFEFLVRHLRQIDINGPVFIRNWYEEDKNTDPSFCVLKEPGLTTEETEVGILQHYDDAVLRSDILAISKVMLKDRY